MYMHLFDPFTTDWTSETCVVLFSWFVIFPICICFLSILRETACIMLFFSPILNIWQRWEVYSEILYTVETYIGVNGYQRRKTNMANNALNKWCSALRKSVERVNKWITFISCIKAINKNYSFEWSCTLDLKIVNLHNTWQLNELFFFPFYKIKNIKCYSLSNETWRFDLLWFAVHVTHQVLKEKKGISFIVSKTDLIILSHSLSLNYEHNFFFML